MPSTQKDNRWRRAAAIDTFTGVEGERWEGEGERYGGWQEGRKRDERCEPSYRDKGPITRVTRGLLIAE